MKGCQQFLLRIVIGVLTVAVFTACVFGQIASVKNDGSSSTLVFASGTGTKVFKANSTKTFLGPAERVCLNPANPIHCSSSAILYGYIGSGWLADLSNVAEMTWIYAPRTIGLTSPAQLAAYLFESNFVIPGSPTAGTLFVAADDAARIYLNGSFVASIGSITDPLLAGDAQNNIHQFDISPLLVTGKNTVSIVLQNGPASFGDCPLPDNYACNPAGVVFGGSATW